MSSVSKALRNKLFNKYTLLSKENFEVKISIEEGDLLIMDNEDELSRIINNLIINVYYKCCNDY
ncbi:MAG: hypothetical protein RSC24_14145 [Clostridium sp.]